MTRMSGLVQGALLLAATIVGGAAVRGPVSTPPQVTIYKTAGCMCCNRWAEHLRQQGFDVVIDSTGILADVNAEHGVSQDLASCHTALVGGYVVVGHVPADAILRLVREQPPLAGISLPGMPVGSPGMEVDGVEPESFSVLAFDEEGNTSVFAEY